MKRRLDGSWRRAARPVARGAEAVAGAIACAAAWPRAAAWIDASTALVNRGAAPRRAEALLRAALAALDDDEDEDEDGDGSTPEGMAPSKRLSVSAKWF